MSESVTLERLDDARPAGSVERGTDPTRVARHAGSQHPIVERVIIRGGQQAQHGAAVGAIGAVQHRLASDRDLGRPAA